MDPYTHARNMKMKFIDATDEYKVEILKPFNFTFEVQNNGNVDWMKGVKVYCVEGDFKGLFEEIDNLKVGEKNKFTFPLQAPNKEGKSLNMFRLGIEVKNNEGKFEVINFG